MKFLVKQKKRSAVSPVIATLLLIAIAVAAAIIVYAFVTGLIGGLTSSGASLVVVSGTLTVPSGSGAGTLVVTITNKASNAMNAIAIATDQLDGASRRNLPASRTAHQLVLAQIRHEQVELRLQCSAASASSPYPRV